MAIKLTEETTQSKTQQSEQEYYNLYYSDEYNCAFTPASNATAKALNADTVYKIVTNQLTNDVQITTTKPRIKGKGASKKTYVNFQVKVMPTAGEFKDKYVSVGFINYFDNDLDENSTEEEKAQTIANLMTALEGLKPEQVSKHMTSEDVKGIIEAL
jgi:hypothetical protein